MEVKGEEKAGETRREGEIKSREMDETEKGSEGSEERKRAGGCWSR